MVLNFCLFFENSGERNLRNDFSFIGCEQTIRICDVPKKKLNK